MLQLRKNSLTLGLKHQLAAFRDQEALHTAMADVTVQLAKRAFNEPSLRPIPWKHKRDNTPCTLRLNQVLCRSPRRVSVTKTNATVASDRKYAAIHQLGGQTRYMPMRPYWPFVGKQGIPTEALKKRIKSALMIVLKRR